MSRSCIIPNGEVMSVDQATVRRIAHLARIAVGEEEVPGLQAELNAMLAFVQDLDAIDVSGIEPMTSVIPMQMPMRADRITDHAGADVIVANAPAREDHFF